MHDKRNSSPFPRDLFSLLNMIFVAVSVTRSYFCGGCKSRERLRRAGKCLTLFSLRATTMELSTIRHYSFIDSVIDLILLNTYYMTKSAWHQQQTNKKDQKKPRRRCSLCAFSLLYSPAGKQTRILVIIPHRGPDWLYAGAMEPQGRIPWIHHSRGTGPNKKQECSGKVFSWNSC